ncbi:MAG: flagellar basal body-associated FliL family protein [Gemmatimonadota bacterium]
MADTEAPNPEQEAEAPKGGLKARLPLIGIIAVGLAVGGGTGAKFLGPMVAAKMGRTMGAPQDTTKHAGADSTAAAEGEGKEGEAGAEGSAPSVLLLENLVLNPAASGGSRFLLMSVAIELSSAGTAADFTARDAELRDIILTALGSKTVDQLTDISLRDGMKSELQSAIAVRFGKTAVKRLYFPQFVVQ